ncbi:hypothetical protein [Saccharopolyspora taberi]|uniref:Uncharacterized protein n=1 Tax=Saccharopolyspora taberi TaxID=60895 RepID=A0ABN3VIR7_9PSEU
MNESDQSMARLRDALGAAVSRGRRAQAEAHENSEGFRRRSREIGDRIRSGELKPEGTGSKRLQSAADYRDRVGLDVERFPAEESDVDDGKNVSESLESQEQTPSDGSDLDFSQAQILR